MVEQEWRKLENTLKETFNKTNVSEDFSNKVLTETKKVFYNTYKPFSKSFTLEMSKPEVGITEMTNSLLKHFSEITTQLFCQIILREIKIYKLENEKPPLN